MSITTGSCDLSLGKTAYRLRGDRDARNLVLVFGGFHFPRNCDPFFDAWATELGRDYAVLGYDYYGRGDSAAPDGRYDAAMYIAQAMELLGALGLDDRKLIALGYSFGGSVAPHFMRAHPERVRALALSGAWCAWDPFPLAARAMVKLGLGAVLMAAWWGSTRTAIIEGFADRAIGPRFADEMLRVERAIVDRDPRGFHRAIVRTFRNYSCARPAVLAVAEQRKPTLLVWGEHDNVSPAAGARAMHAALPGSELLVMPGSHNDLWLVPEMSARLRFELTRFVRAQ